MNITPDDVASRRGGALRSALVTSALLIGGLLPASAAEGIASFYGREEHGGPTASGERFNMNAMTAAHRTARLGSHMRVTNLRNGSSVVVRINDRGPFVKGRIIDLSRAAADRLGFVSSGLTRVAIETVEAGAAEAPNRIAAAETPTRVAATEPETTGSITPKRTRKPTPEAAPKTARGARHEHRGEVEVAMNDRDRYLVSRGEAAN